MIRTAATIGCAALVVGLGWKAQDIRPIVNPPIRDANLDVQENSASASLIGQFRSTASGWLWLRADLYLHNGVEMRPMSEDEGRRGRTVENAKDDGNEKLHKENEVTAVPPRERDFRGLFGDVERRVASYADMHDHGHNDPSVAMPLYRLMTWLDPQFEQGWTMGGMILARDRSPAGTARAIAFLLEGWAANPTSIELPTQIGTTLATRRKDFRGAAAALETARKTAMSRSAPLSPEEQEGLENAYRWLSLCYRELGETRLMRAIAVEGLGRFPSDPLLEGLSKPGKTMGN